VIAAGKWPSLPLTEAFWFQEGPGVRKWQFTTSGIKLLNVANIEKGGTLNLEKTDRHLHETEVAKKYSHFLVDAGDLVIASSGISFDDDGLLRTRGAFVRAEHLPLCLNTSTIRFKAIDGMSDLRFLRLWLNGREFRSQITKLVTGTAQQNFGPSHLKVTNITLPPLAEQRRISEVLDKAEALRAKRRAALAQLDSLTQSLFLDLFGDPITNQKGWPTATLGDMAEMITGYPFRSEEYVTSGRAIRLCRGANILPGRLDWSDLARWPESKVAGLADFKLEAGDVLIAMDRPWISEGFKIARVRQEDCPALLVQRVARLRGGKKLPNEFIFHLLKQPAFTRHCRPTETTVPHISPKDIRSFSFPLPPLDLQREFARRVAAVEKLKTAQRAALAELDALFASLQHRAFRGEL
jgi:type I restriction enzyme S subunit